VPIRIHLDTDLGGDSDDLCALALLLGAPGVEITGVTTVVDEHGQRAAFARHALSLAGRERVPVASGASHQLDGRPLHGGVQDQRYWPGAPRGVPSPPGSALALIERSIRQEATIVAIGPYTNLALFEALWPGRLANSPLVVMGGFIKPPRTGLPRWDPSVDYNVQTDRGAARIVFEQMNALVVPIGTSVETWLRRIDLPTLRSGGPLAQLLARQAQLQAVDEGMEKLSADNGELPPDLLNFQHDPLACAAGLDWECVTVQTLTLRVREGIGGALRLEESHDGRPLKVATAVDSDNFRANWLESVRPV
jgi:purine nucleosidase